MSVRAAAIVLALAVAGLAAGAPARSAFSARAASAPATFAAATVFAPRMTAAPSLSGEAVEDGVLEAAPGTWTRGTLTTTVTWRRCDATGGACVDVEGATGTRRTLTAADVGHTLRARVTATNEGGTSAFTTEASATVRAAAPVATAAPAISGTPERDRVLSADPGTWRSSSTVTTSLQWLRCDGHGAGCAAVDGATGATYVPRAGDVGHALRVRADARNAVGTTSATSEATAAVAEDRYVARLRAEPGLAGLWRLGDAAGTTAFAAEAGAAASLCVAAPASAFGQPGALPGSADGAFAFSAGTCAHTPRPVQDDLTVSFWLSSHAGSCATAGCTWNGQLQWFTAAGLVDGEVPGVADDFGVSLSGDGRVLAGTGNPDVTVASAPGLNDGAWHHVAFTRTRATGELRLYVDGSLAARATGGTQSLRAPASLAFARLASDVHPYTGLLDEVAIHASTLPASAVADLAALGRSA